MPSFSAKSHLFGSGNLESDPLISEIIDEERVHGARIANRLRYVFAAFFLTSVIINADIGNLYFNIFIFVVYAGTTGGHTFLLRKGASLRAPWFDYLAVALDLMVFGCMGIFYTYSSAEGNWAMAVKNPILYIMAGIITATVFQFRIRLTLFAGFFSLLIYFMLLVGAYWSGSPVANNWYEYVLGPSLLIEDVFISRPVVFGATAVCIYYGIIRAMKLAGRIAATEKIKSALARYFSPDVAAELSEHPEYLNEGRRQTVSVLFSDIRGFTTLSENMGPDELSAFLTDLRGRLAQAVFAHRGSLDKFIGDAVMAVFGTPRPTSDAAEDCRNSVRAGLAMFEALQELNAQRDRDGKAQIEMGVGIHSGEVFAGNIGAAGHLEYTVIGDTVNTASRIESACKKLQRQFLISDSVYLAAADLVEVEKMPLIRVRGRTEPIALYAVLGPSLP